MVSLHRNAGLSAKWFIWALILSALVATVTSQRFTRFFPRRTTTTPKTVRTTTKAITTTTTTTTTTAKPYTYVRPASCDTPPPVTATTAAPAAEKGPKMGSCTLSKTAKQVMGQSVRWPNKTVPYTISDAYQPCQRDLIMAAIWEIGNKSCVQFRPKTDSDADYVEFLNTRQTCQSSSVGYMGGVHTIYLDDTVLYKGTWGNCFYMQEDNYVPGSGLAAHEILHILGFQHEHQRPDRNQSIVVNYENILDGEQYNFDIPEGQTVIGAYDLNSVMHYRSTAFAKPNTTSMDALVPGTEIKEGDFLSETDAFKLKTYYECS